MKKDRETKIMFKFLKKLFKKKNKISDIDDAYLLVNKYLSCIAMYGMPIYAEKLKSLELPGRKQRTSYE
jgi:hypothetical protein